jgi:hypothetical protein
MGQASSIKGEVLVQPAVHSPPGYKTSRRIVYAVPSKSAGIPNELSHNMKSLSGTTFKGEAQYAANKHPWLAIFAFDTKSR